MCIFSGLFMIISRGPSDTSWDLLRGHDSQTGSKCFSCLSAGCGYLLEWYSGSILTKRQQLHNYTEKCKQICAVWGLDEVKTIRPTTQWTGLEAFAVGRLQKLGPRVKVFHHFSRKTSGKCTLISTSRIFPVQRVRLQKTTFIGSTLTVLKSTVIVW